jgi:uncharacterized membrane protein
MRRLLYALPLLLAAGCETSPEPYAPVQSVRYQAIGAEPFWLLTIGDDRIVLRTASEGERAWPRSLPRTDERGMRFWQSGEGDGAILIGVRPGPCTAAGGRVHEDEVRIRLAGQELIGCGGRLTHP